MKKISLTFVLVTIPFFILAQENEMELRAIYKKSFDSMRFIGNSDYFFDRKIDLAKSAEFKTVGIDLEILAKTLGEHSFAENVLLSDLVIVGKVKKREFDTNPEAYYHSKFLIRVDETLKGVVQKSRVAVVLVSGRLKGGSYLNVSGETSLFVGEKVILDLRPVNLELMQIERDKGTLQRQINVNGREYDLVDKYPIKANYVFDRYNRKIGMLNEVKETAKKIEAINSSENFLSRLIGAQTTKDK
jgi:hypothetical protein